MLTPGSVMRIEREAKRRGLSPYDVVKEKIKYRKGNTSKRCSGCQHLVSVGEDKHQCWFIGVMLGEDRADVKLDHVCEQWDYRSSPMLEVLNGSGKAD